VVGIATTAAATRRLLIFVHFMKKLYTLCANYHRFVYQFVYKSLFI
jgi:hypothetical protein